MQSLYRAFIKRSRVSSGYVVKRNTTATHAHVGPSVGPSTGPAPYNPSKDISHVVSLWNSPARNPILAIAGLLGGLTWGIHHLDNKIHHLDNKIEAVSQDLGNKLEAVRKDLDNKICSLSNEFKEFKVEFRVLVMDQFIQQRADMRAYRHDSAQKQEQKGDS